MYDTTISSYSWKKKVSREKGHHRRHQQAREIKQGGLVAVERNTIVCDECSRYPHAEWCLAEEDLDGDDLEE